ncbi:MAG: hypothetical protein KDD69_17675 [Bdellovibrionales bacterium]|nr:hypothetical protein [Bdellovibrionales bacterium]
MAPSSRKLVQAWILIGLVAFFAWSGVDLNNPDSYRAFEDLLITVLVWLVRGALLLALLVVCYRLVRRKQKSPAKEPATSDGQSPVLQTSHASLRRRSGQ